MRRVRWSGRARRQQRRWLTYLAGIDPELAARAQEEAEALSAWLGRRTLPGRISRWPDLREHPLQPWHKIFVLQVTETEVLVTAFYDMRQDLDRLRP